MIKKLIKKSRYMRFLENYPRFKLGALLVALLCTFLIIMATFTQMPLFRMTIPEEGFQHPVEFFSGITSILSITKGYFYIPQIPVVIFTGALLGPRIGFFSVATYIILGILGFPIFASGGGITYFAQDSFGYILGYLGAVYLVGNILSARVTTYSIIRAAIVGVLAIHLAGILYLIILMFFEHTSILALVGNIWVKSWIQLPYDIIFSIVTISFARPTRSILWIAMD